MRGIYKYFNIILRKWETIPGIVRVVKLSILADMPLLGDAEHELILHKNINSKYKGKWVVVHANTSHIVAYGKTQKEAISNAENILLRIGEARFLNAVQSARAIIL